MRRVFCFVVAIVGMAAWTWNTQGNQPNKVGDFMKLKLQKAQALLEGIAIEDYDQIQKNAQGLSLLCEEETWRVFQTPDYLQHSEQFRRTADSILNAAKKKNLDAAALGYVAMTMQCVNCHKYVRDVRMASLPNDPIGPKLNSLGLAK